MDDDRFRYLAEAEQAREERLIELIRQAVREEIEAEFKARGNGMPEWASGDYITKNPVFGIGSKKTLERRRTDMAKDPAVDFDGICHKHGASWYYNTSKLLAYLGGVEERKKAEQKLDPRLQQLEEMGL